MIAKLIVAAIVLIAVIVLGVALTRSHWWTVAFNAEIRRSDGQVVPGRVYRHSGGDLLVDLRPADSIYIVVPQEKKIGVSSPSNFITIWPVAYSRNSLPPFSPMNSVKSVEPELTIQGGIIEFDTMNMGRIRIQFASD